MSVKAAVAAVPLVLLLTVLGSACTSGDRAAPAPPPLRSPTLSGGGSGGHR